MRKTPNRRSAAQDARIHKHLSPSDLTGLAWWEYDPTTDTHRWSPGMWAISGLDPTSGPVSLGDWLALIHPDDRAEVEEISKHDY